MKPVPSFFHGSVTARARKMGGWTGRQPHKMAKPNIFRILRSRIIKREYLSLPK